MPGRWNTKPYRADFKFIPQQTTDMITVRWYLIKVSPIVPERPSPRVRSWVNRCAEWWNNLPEMSWVWSLSFLSPKWWRIPPFNRESCIVFYRCIGYGQIRVRLRSMHSSLEANVICCCWWGGWSCRCLERVSWRYWHHCAACTRKNFPWRRS